MAILNFPTNPELDQTYIANNVIYTWNGEYWEANTTNGFDSRYVEVGGDNMTGDLTLGPVGDTQLTLTAADGSITAAGGTVGIRASDGRISVGDYKKETSTAIYKGNISLVSDNGSASVVSIFNSFTSTDSTANITADGSAKFAGDVYCGGDPYSNESGARLLAGGGVGIRGSNGTDAIFAGFVGTTVAPTSKINADGSATFINTGTGVIVGDKTGGTTGYCQVYGAGQVVVQRPSADSSLPIFLGGVQGSGSSTSSIDAAGNGFFQGEVKIGGTQVPSAPNITLGASNSSVIRLKGEGEGATNNPGFFWSGLSGGSGNRYGLYEVNDGLMWRCFDPTMKIIVRNANGSQAAGVQLTNNATSWTNYVSESRLKDIVSDPDKVQCWNLIRDIELKRYFYKEQDAEFKKGVPYMGPMADWLEVQDSELVIHNEPDADGPIRTYNQGLLDAKALQALSTALTRIEALEAKVASLENPTSTADI